MGRYMTVVLKKEYMNDMFIELLNQELTDSYGSNTGIKFITEKFVEEEADFMNTHPEGLKQVPHWPRPITSKILQQNCFWLRVGEFSFKLSAPENSDSARDAVAVCKWLIKTKCRYIIKSASENYDPAIVKEYLNHLFEEEGYNLESLWKIN